MESVCDSCVCGQLRVYKTTVGLAQVEMEGKYLKSIDAVAGIPSKKGFMFKKRKKGKGVSEAVLELRAQYVKINGRPERKKDFRMARETDLTSSLKEKLLFFFCSLSKHGGHGSNN